MGLAVRVADGTNAGRRQVKPLPLWACRCVDVRKIGGVATLVDRPHPGERYSCSDCGMRRP